MWSYRAFGFLLASGFCFMTHAANNQRDITRDLLARDINRSAHAIEEVVINSRLSLASFTGGCIFGMHALDDGGLVPTIASGAFFGSALYFGTKAVQGARAEIDRIEQLEARELRATMEAARAERERQER